MGTVVRRGYAPGDEKEFGEQAAELLHLAGKDLAYLLNQGYAIKGASAFVGNHYQLSERQRLALVRGISSEESIKKRKARELQNISAGSIVHIDGFNTIITLETALSGSVLLRCMDGTIRDLAGLRGTYRLIDKTDRAIRMIGETLEKYQAGKVVFYLDSPVSNSGRLKQRLLELLEGFEFETEAEIMHDVDTVLKRLDHVVTSDAIILDECGSWFNLNAVIIREKIGKYPFVDFPGVYTFC